jgi:hypothetical protein
MNKTIKKKWVAALRSGKYKQGTGRLYQEKKNAFCCLGVLCRVEGMSLKSIRRRYLLPDEVIQTTEVDKISQDVLSRMNDGLGEQHTGKKTFKTIANWIQRHL